MTYPHRCVPTRQTVPIHREYQVPGEGLQETDASQPEAQDLVEQEGLVGVDEEREEVKGQLGQPALEVARSLPQVVEDGVLEAQALREFPQGPDDVPALLEGLPRLEDIFRLSRLRIAKVHHHSALEVPPHDGAAHQVGYGSDLSESLRTEEVGEPAILLELAHEVLQTRRSLFSHGYVSDAHGETIAQEVPECKGPTGPVKRPNLYVLEPHPLEIL